MRPCRSVVKKAVSTVKKAVGQDEATKLERQRQKEREELYKPPDRELSSNAVISPINC